MRLRIAISACIAVLLAAMQPRADEWTLKRALNTALEASNRAAAERLNASEATINSISAVKKLYPTLKLSAGATVMSEIMELDTSFARIRFGDYDSYDMKLAVNQILYDGGRIKALDEAGQARAAMSLHRAEAAELAVEFAAKTVFHRLVMGHEALKAVETSRVEAENHLHEVLALKAEDMARENDVLRARLRVANTEMAIAEKEADVKRAEATFRKVLGLAPGDDIKLRADEAPPSGSQLFRQQFEADRPEFRAFDKALDASKSKQRSYRAGSKPSVVMFGAFNYGRPGINLPANEWMHYFSAGLRLDWTLWDWGSVGRDIEMAELDQRRINLERDDFSRELHEQYETALINLNESRKRAGLAAQAASFSQESLKLVKASYHEGMASETEYDNAHTAYTKAIHDEAVARIAVRLNVAWVEYVTGTRFGG